MVESKKKIRNPLYDNAKGFGILLVIWGHLFSLNGIPFSIIYSFHMPLFFFISGRFLTSHTCLYNKRPLCVGG